MSRSQSVSVSHLSIAQTMNPQEREELAQALQQMPDLPLTNPKKQPLTSEILRTFSGHENLSDQEAEHLILQYDYVSRIFIVFHERFKELCA